MGYKIHYHPLNAPSPPDSPPEAQLPDRLTHQGGGIWVAYKNHTNWAAQVRPLRLPTDCPPATTCVVEITLRSRDKLAIVASYLPQSVKGNERVCRALARLPVALPHRLLVLGGDLQGSWTCPNKKDAHVHAPSLLRWKGAKDLTFVRSL